MIRFGKINAFEYVQCINHAIHLSVIEVLYKRKTTEDDQEQAEIYENSVLSAEGNFKDVSLVAFMTPAFFSFF